MRMPISHFLLSGDLKFVVVLLTLLTAAVIYFFKKKQQPEDQERFNLKIKKLVTWSIYVSIFSLLLGLMHSFYFISKAQGVAPHLLFGGLANVIITPTLGVVIAMIIKLLSTPLSPKKVTQ